MTTRDIKQTHEEILRDPDVAIEYIKVLHKEMEMLKDALKEILEPTGSEYYLGIRCGIEDRALQNDPYEAAEYGYDQGKEYCQFIAAQALKPKETEG